MLILEPAALQIETYTDIRAAVWPNRIYLGSVVATLLPYDFRGSAFILTVSTVGVNVKITITRSTDPDSQSPAGSPPTVIPYIPRHNVEQIRLPLSPGVNRIVAESSIGSTDMWVGVARYATALFVQASDLDTHIVQRLTLREQALLSPTGSVLIERWFREYVNLLPRSNATHRLAMRMVIDGVSHATQGGGVRRLAAAITGNNPVITPIVTDQSIFDQVSPRYLWAEDFAGCDFDVWTLDVSTALFVAAGKYLENMPNLWQIQEFTASRIVFQRVDPTTSLPDGDNQVLQNFEGDSGSSVEDIILTSGCFSRIRPWVSKDKETGFVICAWQFSVAHIVEACYALGTVYFDCSERTMEETITDPDWVDIEDPTGDGWMGTQLAAITGSGDETVPFDIADLGDCPIDTGPPVVALMLTATPSEITITFVGTMTLDIFTIGGPFFAPIWMP